MKKIIVITAIVLVLIFAGIFGFYIIRDVFTDKMMAQLQNDEEVKKYALQIEEQAKKEAEALVEKAEGEKAEEKEEKTKFDSVFEETSQD